ncbi:unnamed protein product [Urochloa humidicola]
MAAVVDAVPATHDGAGGGGGGGADTDVAAAAPAPAFLVPAAAACIAVTACVSGGLVVAYHATLALCLACFARAVWPDRVDAVLVPLGARARRAALLARADLEADLRRLRAHLATAPACAAAARWAGAARRGAEAKWAEHRAAAGAAWFLLRLAGRAARIASAVLLDAAREEAAAHAPSVMAYLRGLVLPGGASSSPATSAKEGDEGGDAGFELWDVVCLAGIAFYLLFSVRFILSFNLSTKSWMQLCGACSVVMCGLSALVADWIDPLDDDDSDDDDTGTTAAGEDDTARQEGCGDARLGDAELEEVRESWQFMYVLIFMAFCSDALVLHAAFGPQPIVLLLLAACNFFVLDIGKDVQLAPDDGEGAAAVDEAVNTWRWGAVWVFVASSVKVFLVYLLVDFYMAALSFLWLCVMADLLLAEEDSLLELYEPGGDEGREEGDAGSGAEDVNGGAEGGADEADHVHSDTSSSEDEEADHVHSDTSSSEDEEADYVLEERTNATSSEDEEEDYVLEDQDYVLEEHCHSPEERANNATSSEDEEGDATEEHCDGSEEHEHLKEQRQEETGCSRGGSVDDGWDLVEVDPEMPVKYETRANHKSSSLLPWK